MLSAVDTALIWADSLYARLKNPGSDGVYYAREAITAYREVARKFPADPRPVVGIARCLFRMNRYHEAAKAYTRTSSVPAEAATAAHFAKIASEIERSLRASAHVLAMARCSKTDWAVLTGLPGDPPSQLLGVRVQIFREAVAGTVAAGAAVELPSEQCVNAPVLYAPTGIRPQFVVQTQCPAAGSSQTETFVIDPRGKAPKVSVPLKDVYGTRMWLSNGLLTVAVMPTYKVIWSDVYEWFGNAFRFANARHPKEFERFKRPKGEEARDYAAWSAYAAALTIRRCPTALNAWRTAERYARLAACETKWGVGYYDRIYGDHGFIGDPLANARLIRKRIAWLKRGEKDHILLYRPYGFDVQAPVR